MASDQQPPKRQGSFGQRQRPVKRTTALILRLLAAVHRSAGHLACYHQQHQMAVAFQFCLAVVIAAVAKRFDDCGSLAAEQRTVLDRERVSTFGPESVGDD